MLIYRDERIEFPPSYYGISPGYSYSNPPWILPPAPWYPIYHTSTMDLKYPSTISYQSDESTRSSISPDNRSIELYNRYDHYKTQEEKTSNDALYTQQRVCHEIDAFASRDENTFAGKRIKQHFYECHWKDCTCVFTSMISLSNHVSTNHAVTKGGLFYCCWEGCPRSHRGFNARYKMLVHVRTHTNEKPHKCNQCNKSFSRAENLKIHTRSHSGEKPYVCLIEGCNKAYSNSSDRFKHTKTHSVDKPYFCKIPGCLKRYTDPSSLRKHVKTFKHNKITTPGDLNIAQMQTSDERNNSYLYDSDVDNSSKLSEKSVTPPLSDKDILSDTFNERNDPETFYRDIKSDNDLYFVNPLTNSTQDNLILKMDCVNSDNLEYVDVESEEPLDLVRYSNKNSGHLNHEIEIKCRRSEYNVQIVPSDLPLDLRINK